jgi:hypothetical protein
MKSLVMEELLVSATTNDRLTGLNLAVTTSSNTKPFAATTLAALKKSMPLFFQEQQSAPRGEALGLLTKMVSRLQGATYKLSQSIKRQEKAAPETGVEEIQELRFILEQHTSFIKWFVSIIPSELHPESGYQRTIFALKTLQILVKSGIDTSLRIAAPEIYKILPKWTIRVDLYSFENIRLLCDLIMNPYEDIRTFAAQHMRTWLTLQVAMFGGIPLRFIDVVERAEIKMQQTGRADHADGVSRMYAIIFYIASTSPPMGPPGYIIPWSESKLGTVRGLLKALNNSIQHYQRDQVHAISESPIHGILLSLRSVQLIMLTHICSNPTRYCFEQADVYKALEKAPEVEKVEWRSIYHQFGLALKEIWTCVKDTLCNDAPEGYVPDEIEEDNGITTKDILSYSWRALKEAR